MKNISVHNIFGTYNYYAVSFTHHKVHPGERIWFEEGVRAGSVSIKNIFRTQSEVSNAPTLRLIGDVKINRLKLCGIFESLNGTKSFVELDRSCIKELSIKEDTL